MSPSPWALQILLMSGFSWGAGRLSRPGASASPPSPSLLCEAPGPTMSQLGVMGCRAEPTHILTELANKWTKSRVAY